MAAQQSSHAAHDSMRRPSFMGGQSSFSSDRSGQRTASPFAGPSPAAHQAVPYNANNQAHFQTPGSGQVAGPPMHTTPSFPHHTPHGAANQMTPQAVQYQSQQHRMPHQHAQQPVNQAQPHMVNTMAAGYNQSPAAQPPRPHMAQTGQPGGNNMYNPPRPAEVYSLPENLDDAIPGSVRENFQTDAQGHVIFFTSPPLDRTQKTGVAPSSAALGHSVKYLAGRKEWLTEREKKRKDRDERGAPESPKRATLVQSDRDEMASQAAGAVNGWFKQLDADTMSWKKDTGLEGWSEQQLVGNETST